MLNILVKVERKINGNNFLEGRIFHPKQTGNESELQAKNNLKMIILQSRWIVKIR